jgi:hypothetical protein
VIVELRLDVERPRAWMGRMMTLVDGEQAMIQVKWVETDASRPRGLEALFELERMVLRKGRRCGADVINKDDLKAPRRNDRKADIIIDFSNAEREASSSPQLYLRPLYNGAIGENAALAAILTGDLPRIDIRNDISGEILDAGQPSAETADGLSGALDAVMARTMTLLKAALSEKPRRFQQKPGGSAPGTPGSPASYVFLGLASAIAKRIYRLCCYAPHWHVGWRYTDDAGIWSSRDLSGSPWAIVADPGHRFYADPFPVTWQGRTFVFFEDLDHRVGKGMISAIEFDGAGPKGPVTPVLEEPWHLSYPFLIEHDGALWMIPESSENRDVALYRCIDFPSRWERHSTLLTGLELGDATIVRHNGLNYLFGATRDGGGGYSDTLSIFHANHLFGPWLPHAGNPIMVDRSGARPAGNFFTINGQLWRPVQDCSDGYGAALGLAEVTELSPACFSQIVRHTLAPGSRWPGRKLHTLNRCGRLEVIDGTRIQPKIRALRPLINMTAAS